MNDAPALVAAAHSLLEELARFEKLSDELKDMPLRSKKHLERAGRRLQEVAESEDRMSQQVRALDQAISASRSRHEALAVTVSAEAERINQRTLAYQALLIRVQALGGKAAQLNQSFAALAEQGGDLASAAAEVASVLADVRTVAQAAREEDFIDVARDVDALVQQLEAVEKKLGRVAPQALN